MAKSSTRKLEYGKEYYERNKERIKARRRERWKNADNEMRERQREYSLEHYHANKEKSNARAVAWMRENRDLVNARARLARYKKQGKDEAAKNEEEFIAVLLEKKQQTKKSRG